MVADKPDSSFFHVQYRGTRVLVLAPHQDDEINLSAISIQNFVRSGAEVFVAFSTNGDFDFPADTRLNEAARALEIFGVDREHIIVMGYGDKFNESPGKHIFHAEGDLPIASPSGHIETYGAAGFQDFAYITRKQHSPYTKSNYIRDLKELILYVHADIILAVDFDTHCDHRMLTLSFDEAMRQILSRPNNTYKPQVLKRFAYPTAFESCEDFFADRLLSNRWNVPDERKKQLLNISCYTWKDRIRIPTPEDCRKPILTGNPIVQALIQHDTQYGMLYAERIINSDEVFFLRRTDSLTHSAQVSATSATSTYVHDFRLYNVSDVDSPSPDWENYLWLPDDDAKTLSFKWAQSQTISRIVLWGNIDGVPVQSVRVSMSSGLTLETKALPENGLPLVLDFPEQKGITELTIAITQGSKDSGLAEVEIFEHREQEGVIEPFIQIMSNDNFVYDYDRMPDEKVIPVECYCYRADEAVKWEVFGAAHLEGSNLVFDGDGDVVLRASIGDIFCQSVFHADGEQRLKALHAEQKRNQIWLKRNYKNPARVRYYKQMLREKGISGVIKHVITKIISKLRRK